jgi:hypothetical protein
MKRRVPSPSTMCSLAVAAVLAGFGQPPAYADDDRDDNTLLVWAGDQARSKPDFIAIVDFDRESPSYGKVLGTVQAL